MEFDKEKVAEKMRKKKEDFSNWKDTRFDPWYRHTFKPKVKQAKKDLKRNVKNTIKSYRKRRNKRLKRKYSRSDNYNINIRNIENIENFAVGSKHQRKFEGIPQNYQLPAPNNASPKINYKEPYSPPQNTNKLTYQPNNSQKPNLDLEKLSNWHDEIQNLYNLGYYPEVVIEANNLVKYFLSRLAEYLNISYRSVDDFLFRVNERGIGFQFYEEFKDYSRYLAIGTQKIGESAYWIFGIISKIINRLYKIAGSTH